LNRSREMVWRIMRNLAGARMSEEILGWPPFSRHLITLMEKYHPQPSSDVVINLYCDRASVQAHPLHAWKTSHLQDGGWNHWIHNRPRIHWLEGDHYTIIKPPLVSSLAQSIRKAMDQHLERRSPPPGHTCGKVR